MQDYSCCTGKQTKKTKCLPGYVWAQQQNYFWGLSSCRRVFWVVLKRKEITVKPLGMNAFLPTGGDSPKITPGLHEDLGLSNLHALLGVCIYAKLSGRLQVWTCLKKKDDYMDQTESPCLNERVNSLCVYRGFHVVSGSGECRMP